MTLSCDIFTPTPKKGEIGGPNSASCARLGPTSVMNKIFGRNFGRNFLIVWRLECAERVEVDPELALDPDCIRGPRESTRANSS